MTTKYINQVKKASNYNQKNLESLNNNYQYYIWEKIIFFNRDHTRKI